MIARRSFLAAAKPLPTLRDQFPWAATQTYLNSAGYHPLSVRADRAMRRYLDSIVRGPGPGRLPFGEPEVAELKGLFGGLINARPHEIAVVMSTMAGENMVAEALQLEASGGNVVTDELHYHGGLHLYHELAKSGRLEVRVVKQKDWRTSPAGFERLVDRKTRLIAITLVSNINGHLADARALSDLAHAHGALLYADIIQAAGCIPVDVRKLGIDFAAAGSYKWLMGPAGMGFLYVKEELLDRLHVPHHGDGQYLDFVYHFFPNSPPGTRPFSFTRKPGAARFEPGQLPFAAMAAQAEALRLLRETGVGRIQAHSQPLTRRVCREVAALGYPCITPPDSPAPIAAFLAERPEALAARMKKARIEVKIKWKQLRVSPSIFNNGTDVDRLLEALS